MSKNAIGFDFDGVIHLIPEGAKIGEINGELNREVIETIYELNKMDIPVFVFSSRAPSQIVDWLNKQGLKLEARVIDSNTFFFNDTDYIGVTQRKLPAQLYIDDRAFNYSGQTKKDLLLYIVKG